MPLLSASANFKGVGGSSVSTLLAQSGLVAFSGGGSLTAVGTLFRGSASFNGSGLLTASVRLGNVALVRFAGAGNFTAAGTLFRGSATFSGTGSLAASALLHELASITFAGAGLFRYQPPASIIFAGGSLIPATVLVSDAGSALVSDSGAVLITDDSFKGATLTVSAFLVEQASAIFLGSGFLGGIYNIANSVNARLGAIGEFPLGQQQHILYGIPFVAFLGAGSLSVGSKIQEFSSVYFAGDGQLCAQAYVRIGRKGPTTNVAESGSGASSNIVVGGG